MSQQTEIVEQLLTACQRSGFAPSKLSVLSYIVFDQWNSLVTYLVFVKKIVRRASGENPGKYWQVTSNLLIFIVLDSRTGKAFSTRNGLCLTRNEFLRANRLLKEGVNPIKRMDVQAISKWNDKEKSDFSRSIWLS